MNIKKSAGTNDQMRYCPTWAAPKKKGLLKKDICKLGILDHVKQGVAARRCRNPSVAETVVKEVNEDDRGIQDFEDLKKEQEVCRRFMFRLS